MVWIILIAAAIILIVIAAKRKQIRLGDVSCVTGGVKTGKSIVTLTLARRKYKSNLRKWKLKKILCKIFRKEIPEKPLFYSNIRLGWEYVPMTREIFLREKRLAYKSVAFVDESSLIADSMDWKDKNINERLKMFNKLFGHETHGGSLYYNTQVMRDNHYAIKRCMNNYIYIHHSIKWIPFVYVSLVGELFYTEEGEMPAFKSGDPSQGLRWIISPKAVYKKYDCYTYSCFTDDLPVATETECYPDKEDQKTPYIIDLRDKK